VTFPQDTWLRAMAPGTVTFKYSGDGNTWMPGQQGADGSASYSMATTLSSGASGPNATVGTGASLVLAP
jgi:hypothetical protein